MNKIMEAVPAHMREDWEGIILRPGMNVLSTFIYELRKNVSRELENPALDTMEKVEHRRGQIVAYNKIISFVKSEFDRAAKGDTPAKKED
jgi:hypothetical protein